MVLHPAGAVSLKSAGVHWLRGGRGGVAANHRGLWPSGGAAAVRATALGEQPFGCCKAFRAGAAAARGSRPPRGSASCSNTRSRYIHVPLGREPLASTSFAGRDVLVSLGHSNSKSSAQRRCPCSTKPRASTWRKTRWCGDRAQAGHGWPAFACWSQGRRNQAMRTIPALPRLPPKATNPGALRLHCRGFHRSPWTPALINLARSARPPVTGPSRGRLRSLVCASP